MLQTVENAGRVLALFSNDAPEWGVSEVSAELELSKSGSHALLSTLADIGLLRRTHDNRYRVGWRVLSLSTTLTETTDFLSDAPRVLENLVAQTGETVHLATFQNTRAVYVRRLDGNRAVQISITHSGATLPAHCSGVGKVLLAYRQWSEVEAIVARAGLPALTENTITDIEALQVELASIRRAGYAWDREEILEEVSCVAAPIRDRSGFVIAALSLTAPTYRLRKHSRQYRDAVGRAAQMLSLSSAEAGRKEAARLAAGTIA
jgi:DNA-binding IclR family transcriptional regulator